MLLGHFFRGNLVSCKAMIWAFSCSWYLSNPFFILARKPATFQLQIFRGYSANRDAGNRPPFVNLNTCAAFSFVILCACESQFVIFSVLRNFSAIAEIFSDCLEFNSHFGEVSVVFLVSISARWCWALSFCCGRLGVSMPFNVNSSIRQSSTSSRPGISLLGGKLLTPDFLTSLFSITSSVTTGGSLASPRPVDPLKYWVPLGTISREHIPSFASPIGPSQSS